MKPLSLGYQKIDMCPNFCMLYYLENVELTSAWHVGILVTNPELARKRLSLYIKNLDTSQSCLDCRGYSCHQGLLSTWHGTNHIMWLMEWWCILLMAKHGNTLTVCILTFQLNQGTCILGFVYRQIQPIRVIYCSLFLLAGHTHDL
jgi:hypothetical protein